MKKIKLYILIIILFPIVVKATTTGTVNVNDSLTLRDKPSVSGNYITSFYNGTELNIIDTNAGSDSVCSKWYKVSYGNYIGYSCGDYITIKNISIPTYDSEDDSYNRNNYNNPLSKDGSVMCYEDTGDLNLRKTPGGSTTGYKVGCGEEVNINDIKEGSGTCPYYYNITSGNKTGWVCGYFVNTTKLSSTATKYYNNNVNGDTIESYTNKLKNKGFSDSYIPYLLEIHARHNNWNFDAEKINLNFDDVVIGENGNGASLLEKNAFSKSYLSINSNTYDVYKDEYKDFSGEVGYSNASREAIAYFLDPRNYLNEKYIFAFETLGYSSNHTTDVVNSIINPQTFWTRLYSDGSVGASKDIVNSTKEIGISSVHVASRIKQEMGNGNYLYDSRVGGTFTYDGTTKSGYYNFFNIKSNSGRGSSIYASYAYENGWNTPYKGIYGGSKFMYDGYISLNQDTIYYEKFDISTNNGNYTHQYMQNLAAPIQESGIKYNGYKNNNSSYLNTAITFVIPVFDNMPKYAVTAPKVGSVNNYLSSLKIDGNDINGFNYDIYNYNIYLKSNIENVDIKATTIVNTANINGTGNIAIKSNNQTNKITVTSENGKTRIYTLNFIREEVSNDNTNNNNTETNNNDSNANNDIKLDDNKTILELMNNSGFKYNNNYIFGIEVGSNVSRLIGNISTYDKYSSVLVKSISGQNKTNDIFKTGDIITISNGKDSNNYTTLIYGDVNGDGKITAIDYVAIKNHIMNYQRLSGVYLSAADTNKDGKVSAIDYVQIKNSIMGKSKITQ